MPQEPRQETALRPDGARDAPVDEDSGGPSRQHFDRLGSLGQRFFLESLLLELRLLDEDFFFVFLLEDFFLLVRSAGTVE
ncbi:MAG: hypothetical protein CL928_02055 [Deltaproteobacteria bacterium]|nr:hypothetical protein [Deltaproteobacteria bacterium]